MRTGVAAYMLRTLLRPCGRMCVPLMPRKGDYEAVQCKTCERAVQKWARLHTDVL